MKQIRCFFDLDDTLYDTEYMFAPIRDDMEDLGYSRARIIRVYKEVSRVGYSFEAHLLGLGASPDVILRKAKEYQTRLHEGETYLFPGVLQGLRRLSRYVECLLVTYGYPPYQADKVAGIRVFQTIFEEIHYVWRRKTKAEIIGVYPHDMPTYFFENSPDELLKVQKRLPHVRLVRITWAHMPDRSHELDNLLWRTVRSFEEFEDLLHHDHPYVFQTVPPTAAS